MSDETAELEPVEGDEGPPPEEATPEAPEFSGVEVPTDGDTLLRVGDWEGPASEFNTRYLTQGAVQQMREKDKSSLATQIQQATQKAESAAATKYQEDLIRLQRQMQPQPEQQPAAPGMDALTALYERVNSSAHQGYMHTSDFQEAVGHLIGMMQNELSVRDERFNALGGGLETWYGESQARKKILDSLSGNHVDTQWGTFIDSLEKDFGKTLPRSTLELMASAYEAGDDETPDQLREGIRESIGNEITAFKAHSAKASQADKKRQDAAAAAGLPGTGGTAAPSKGEKMLRDAGDIVDRFSNAGGPPS